MSTIDYSGLKIETGVPVSPRETRTGITGLLRKLEVGQSVLIPKDGKSRQALNIRSSATGLTSTTGAKFTCRTQETGVRVHRIK